MKHKTIRTTLLALAILGAAHHVSQFQAHAATAAPAPLAPLPTPAQLAWQNDDLALLLNCGINTFPGNEQGTGKEDPKLFNPAQLDARQWTRVARECGFKRLILPAKGHEGFCLW